MKDFEHLVREELTRVGPGPSADALRRRARMRRVRRTGGTVAAVALVVAGIGAGARLHSATPSHIQVAQHVPKTTTGRAGVAPTSQPLSSNVAAIVEPAVGFTGDTLTAFAQVLSHAPVALAIVRVDFGDGTTLRPPTPGPCHLRTLHPPDMFNSPAVSHQYAQPGEHKIQIWSRLGCSGDNPLQFSTATAYSYPAAPAQTGGWPRCQAAQLTATVSADGVAGGNVGVQVILRNVSAGDCQLAGYPGLQLLAANGATLPTTVTRGGSYLFPAIAPHVVGLGRGHSASFDLAYGDNPIGNPPPSYQQACPQAAQLAIIPPDDVTPLEATARIAPCGGDLTTSPIVPGTVWIPFG